MEICNIISGGVPLQPVSLNPINDLLNPQSIPSSSAATNKNIPIGATWQDSGKVNINLDDLFGAKGQKPGPAPSMNQLKSTPTSPVHDSNGHMYQHARPMNQNIVNNISFAQTKGFNSMPTGNANIFPGNPMAFNNNNNNGNLNSPMGNLNANNAMSSGLGQFASGQNQHSNMQPFFQAQFK